MKSFNIMGFGARKSKSGFTLIELLIVMVILAILAGVIVLAVAGVFKTTGDAAYTSVKSEIENAVTGYASQSSHPGEMPILDYKITIGSTNYSVINFSALLIANGGLMKTMPTGLFLNTSGAAHSDNCDVAADTGCKITNHYVWYVDDVGNIISRCFNGSGSACTDGNADKYQNIWP